MRSQLAAQFMPFFRLIARILTFRDKKYRILTFRDKKYRILTFCDKTELYLTVLQQNNVEACLRCEASLSFVPYCSLLLSEFAYNILARLTRPLLSSQRRCCAATLSAALSSIVCTSQLTLLQLSFCSQITSVAEGGASTDQDLGVFSKKMGKPCPTGVGARYAIASRKGQPY